MSPKTSLLRTLNLWQKFAVLGALGAVLCAAPLGLYLRDASKAIDTAHGERDGIAPTRSAMDIMGALQMHRVLSSLALQGRPLANRREEASAAVEKHIAALDAALPSGSPRLNAHWSQHFKPKWRDVARAVKTRQIDAAESLKQHNLLVQQALETIDLVADATGISLDPESNTYFAAIATVTHGPRLSEALAQMRGRGTLLLASKERSEADLTALRVMVATATTARDQLATQYDKIFSIDAQLKAALQGPLDAALGQTGQAIGLTQSQLLEGNKPTLGHEEFLTRQTTAVAAQSQLNDATLEAFSQALQTRYTAMERSRLLLTGALVALAALAVFIAWAIVRSITRPIGQAISTAQAIQSGRLDNAIEEHHRDEAGLLLRTLKTMQTSLNERNASDQITLAENLRIRRALESCSTNVMIADASGKIIFQNTSVVSMLKGNETELRKVLPQFDASRVVGQSFDVFHKNPAHQQNLLGKLTGEYKAQIKVGTLDFSLIANPIFDEHRQRVGTVVEWKDMTLELAARQREVLLAAENARVKQALDICSTNVMIADANGQIIYNNTSVAQMMQRNEGELRKVLPTFEARSIVGSSFDQFHKNPSHQRNLLGNLKAEYKTEIKVGALTFSLIANPINDAQGLRLGTVVEWKDRTAEVAAESEISSVVDKANEGDFSIRLATEGKEPFFAKLGGLFNSLIDTVTKTIVEVRLAADQLTSASSQVSQTSQSLSQSASEQAASVEETTASLQEIAASVKQNSQNATFTDGMAAKAAQEALSGGEAVSKTTQAMKSIATKISIVDDIAYQTNLLALNAAIEAARAGEHGKGFAVVAAEVRKLAERSQVAAREIGELASSSVGLAEQAGTLLQQMVPSINKTSELVQEIAATSGEQAGGVNQINTAMGHLNTATQQNASAAEELSATAEELSAQAAQLQELMGFFRIIDAGRTVSSHRLTAAPPRSSAPPARSAQAYAPPAAPSRPRTAGPSPALNHLPSFTDDPAHSQD